MSSFLHRCGLCGGRPFAGTKDWDAYLWQDGTL